MGYGIVLWLDHRGLDELDDEALGGALAAVAGEDPYHSGGLDEAVCGPWQRAGAWHSNQSVELVADTGGVRVGTGGGVGTWDRTETVGEWAGRHRRAMADRTGRALRELTASLVTERGCASVWWLHADCITAFSSVDPAEVGAAVRAAVTERVGGTVGVGNWMNALNCAGRVTHSPVALWWEGNRLWDRAGDHELV